MSEVSSGNGSGPRASADLARQSNQAMSSKTPTAENTAATTVEEQDERQLESGRIERALTGDFEICDHEDDMSYVVQRAGHDSHLVDVEMAICDCKDSFFTGFVCIHLVRAALHHTFQQDRRNTKLVARVLADLSARSEDGCVFGVESCAGPTQKGERGYPCPGCVRASGASDWDVWATLNHVEGHESDTNGDPEVVCDGGHESLPVRCTECGERYELTTETGNDCPNCSFVAFEVIDEDEVEN